MDSREPARPCLCKTRGCYTYAPLWLPKYSLWKKRSESTHVTELENRARFRTLLLTVLSTMKSSDCEQVKRWLRRCHSVVRYWVSLTSKHTRHQRPSLSQYTAKTNKPMPILSCEVSSHAEFIIRPIHNSGIELRFSIFFLLPMARFLPPVGIYSFKGRIRTAKATAAGRLRDTVASRCQRAPRRHSRAADASAYAAISAMSQQTALDTTSICGNRLLASIVAVSFTG